MAIQEPVQIVLGRERRAIGCGHKRRVAEVEDTMVYIPILKTIQCLLNNASLVAEVKTVPKYSVVLYNYSVSVIELVIGEQVHKYEITHLLKTLKQCLYMYAYSILTTACYYF